MSISIEARRSFHRLANAPEVDVLEFMLVLAGSIDPQADIQTCRDTLDRICELIGPLVERGTSESDRIERFVLGMRELGFRGNTDHYYDVRNTLITDVVARRTGIPISLSVVFLSVASRLGLRLWPVRFPMHFLLACADVPGLYIDPFFGTTRDKQSCGELLEQMSGGELQPSEEYFAIATRRQMIVRVLRNLKNLHRASGALQNAVDCCDLILLFDPEQAYEYRDRGTMALSVGEWSRAVDDLSTYLAMVPRASDRSGILRQLNWILTQQTSVH